MINALTGCCVFCGSPQIISAKDDLSQRDADARQHNAIAAARYMRA